jgi:serine/threonine-protein kinase
VCSSDLNADEPTLAVDLSSLAQREGALGRGDTVGIFVIDGFIAAGGFANVYRAHDSRDGTVCALKVLHHMHAITPETVLRFEREARIASNLEHPNIVKVLHVGTLGEAQPYFAMELLPERTLQTVMQQRGAMSPSDVLGYMGPIASALTVAHEHGIVHRDLKATNIAVVDEGPPPVVKLLDFGIAKILHPDGKQLALTRIGDRLGTTSHMAPEQIRGEPVDHRVDIYSFGVVLFRMLTGRPPFEASNPMDVERMHLETPAPLLRTLVPSASAGLERVLAKCLEKRRTDRFSSMTELREAFAAELASVPVSSVSTRPAFAIALVVTANDDEDHLDELADLLDEAEGVLADAGLTIVAAPPNGALGVQCFDSSPTAEELAPLKAAAARLEFLARGALEVSVTTKSGDAVLGEGQGTPIITGGSLSAPFW